MSRTHPLGYPKRNRLIDNNVDTSNVTGPAVDCIITSIRAETAGAANFTLVDKAATPNRWYDTVTVAANSVLNEQFPEQNGLKCEGGFDYVASAADMDLQIVYWTNPDLA